MRIRRPIYASFLFAVLLMFLLSCPAGAVVRVNPITDVTIYSYKNTAYLNWKKLANPDGYEIATVNARGKVIDTKKVKTNAVVLKNLKSATYRFQIRGFKIRTSTKKIDADIIEEYTETYYGEYSPIILYKPAPLLPAPATFAEETRGNKSVTLTWSKVSGAKGYLIEALDAKTGKYGTLARITDPNATRVTIKKLKADTTYTLRIRAYNSKGAQEALGTPGKKIKVNIVALAADYSKIRTAYYVGTLRETITCKTSKGATIKLNAGTTVYTTSRAATTTTAYLADGTRTSIPTSKINYTGLDCSPNNDYSALAKEQYINLKGYTSQTKRLIWVSQHKVKVNVFYGSKGNWKLEQVFPCVIGRYNCKTPSGLHKILRSVSYGAHGGPVLYFTVGVCNGGTPDYALGNAFHNQIDSNMSVAASSGCVRVPLPNLQWLYNNCPVGTTVLVY